MALLERSKALFKGFRAVSPGRWVSGKIINNIYPSDGSMGCFRAGSAATTDLECDRDFPTRIRRGTPNIFVVSELGRNATS